MSKYGHKPGNWFEAIVNKMGGEEQAERFLRGELVFKERSGLLKRVATVLARGTAKFVDEDRLKEANIGWLGGSFEKLFLKKMEENVDDAAIAVHRLERASKNAPIMAELGNGAEIKLAHFFSLLEAQSKRQEGALLVNGYPNIAYIIGDDGNFWAVFASWNSGSRYWGIDARSVVSPSGWYKGFHVLSCDSL